MLFSSPFGFTLTDFKAFVKRGEKFKISSLTVQSMRNQDIGSRDIINDLSNIELDN